MLPLAVIFVNTGLMLGKNITERQAHILFPLEHGWATTRHVVYVP